MPNLKPLSNLTAVVTGASSGIGKAVAIALGVAGANVVLDYIGDPAGAEEAAAQIRTAGSQAPTIQCDVNQYDQIIAMFQKAVATFGTVDILINNAGLQKDSPFRGHDRGAMGFGAKCQPQRAVPLRPGSHPGVHSPGSKAISIGRFG